ncbi:MAG: ATP-dependent sacrificial sulfur transferase LarE [Chthoniobacterales bacterium]
MNAKRTTLRNLLQEYAPLLIAYSGGVDSTYLLAEAAEVLGTRVLGVIADSPSLPRQALAVALENAERFGARVRVLQTRELDDTRYASNPVNRCYFCKAELFGRMRVLAREGGFHSLAYGENADDARQLRPGSQAALEFKVVAPLRESGLTKAEIRHLSRSRGLPTADQPAQPCLSSRILHGTPVTREALALVENAEQIVRLHGFRVFRVRYAAVPGERPRARLQVARDEMPALSRCASHLSSQLRGLGFSEVVIDPEGYRPPEAWAPKANGAK